MLDNKGIYNIRQPHILFSNQVNTFVMAFKISSHDGVVVLAIVFFAIAVHGAWSMEP
jgi:hypothetical protein